MTKIDNRQKAFICFWLLVLFSSHFAVAGRTIAPTQANKLLAGKRTLLFEENKGQLGLGAGDIKYYGYQNGVGVYCSSNKISFVFTRQHHRDSALGIKNKTGKAQVHKRDTLQTARMEMMLKGANAHVQIVPEGRQAATANYYLLACGAQGITGINSFNKLTYKDIYPNIDMILLANAQGLEYSFIVHPGGNVNAIQIAWNGADNTEYMEGGGLRYSNKLGTIANGAPSSFTGAATIESHYQFNGESLGFEVANYDKSQDLTIDPQLSWATYYGGSDFEWGYGVCADTSGNVFIAGWTASHDISTSGAYSSSQTSNQDIYIAKFDAAGHCIWSTYCGGDGADGAMKICCDPTGNLFITGYATSDTGLATSGTYQTALGGYQDAFLAKFNTDGKRIWITLFGGEGDEEGEGVSSDAAGNIYICGFTTSRHGVATAGAYGNNPPYGTLGQSAFLAQFSNAGSLSWATYFGNGGNITVANDASTDPSGNVVITGTTNGGDSIASSGAYKTYQGATDAFIAKFNTSGGLQWSTYFGGTGKEYGYGVTTDARGEIYITGSTGSTGGIASSSAVYQSFNNGFDDVFLARFTGAGKLRWSTYYGGKSSEGAAAICGDPYGGIYITGATYSSVGIATTGAYQTSYHVGFEDAFLARFDTTGALTWGTYYGDSAYDEGRTVCTYKNAVYMFGRSDSYKGITTPGAYKTKKIGANSDAMLVKFLNTIPLDAGIDTIKSPANTVCVGAWPVKVRLHNYGSQTLTSAKINWTINGLAQSSYAWTGSLAKDSFTDILLNARDSFAAGTYKIKAYTSLPNGGVDDEDGNNTFTMNLKVLANPKPAVGPAKGICQSSTTSIGATTQAGYTYQWSSSPVGFTSSNANPIVKPDSNTTYILTESIIAGGCKSTDSVKITVYPLPHANAGPDALLCIDQEYTMKAKGGGTITWIPATYLSSPNDSNAKAHLPNTQRYILVVANIHGCTDTSTVLLKVRPRLKIKAFSSDTEVCYGQIVKLSANAQGGDSMNYHFSWTSDSITGQSVRMKITKSDWYKLVLNDYCTPKTVSDSIYIRLKPNAKAAFSYAPVNARVGRVINFINQSQYADAYLWHFDTKDNSRSVSPQYTYTDSGIYKIVLIAYSQYGCANDTAYDYIHVIKNIVKIAIPNIFSPNGDGLNDVFSINGIGFESSTFHIYNRWGEHIFQSSPAHPAWDGTYQGKDVPEGVYLYTVDVYDLDGEHHYLHGTVTVVRP